jgi:MYXO-CTERM domain-containing protein
MKKYTWLLSGLLLALAPVPAGAVSFSLAPSSLLGTVGTSFDLRLEVSGLGGADASSLSAYDFDLTFDASQLSFDSAEFGTLLGGPAFSLQDSGLTSAGVVDLAELSLLGKTELDGLQGDSFVLATLHFTPVAAGTSNIGFSQALVARGDGAPIREFSLAPATVTASERAIPEPGAFALFALGALAVVRRRPRRA